MDIDFSCLASGIEEGGWRLPSFAGLQNVDIVIYTSLTKDIRSVHTKQAVGFLVLQETIGFFGSVQGNSLPQKQFSTH